MRVVTAVLVKNEVEPGWTILDESIPLGKRYRVDLDDVERLRMINTLTGKSVLLDAIMIVEHGRPTGYIPLMALKIEADA
jgi:hypothetical protein